jgi:hypothetical protein
MAWTAAAERATFAAAWRAGFANGSDHDRVATVELLAGPGVLS